MHIGFPHADPASCGPDDRCNAVKQRGFPGAAASHNPQKLAGHHLKGNAVESLCLIISFPIRLAQGINFKNLCCHIVPLLSCLYTS